MLALPALASATARLRVDDTGLAAEDIAASQRLIDTAVEILPARLRDALPEETRLGWRDLPEQVHGRARGDRLWLNRDLLPGWRDLALATAQAQRASPALRALIHELAHRYDRSAQGGVSRDPRFLDLAGWSLQPWPWGGRGARNGFTDRSPDAYELSRPAEYFAVNLEWWLLDPEYTCRRPAMARYLADRFGVKNSATCANEQVFVAPASLDGASEWLTLDPSRVYAVDYLLAEGNQQAMSRWGHSMLRLIICAPGRAPGPDCRLDLAYHRVLSFRAFVGDVQISSWRGLTGSYPSRLFVLPLDQVIDEYTRVELRGLQSLPLRLSREEIAALLERAAQLHWSYDGRYYFISNNCAVETWHLLRDAAPRLSGLPLRGYSPNGLGQRLARAGVADATVLADRDEARRQGYYFEAMSARFEQLFAVAQRALPLPQRDATAWLAAAPEQRRPWLEQGDLRVSAALLVLEEAALRQQELRVRDALKRRLLSGQGEPRSEVEAWLREGEFMSRPALLASGGYGLPQGDEREQLRTELAARSGKMQSADRRLREAARAWLPAQEREKLEATQANVTRIGERVRRLAGKDNR